MSLEIVYTYKCDRCDVVVSKDDKSLPSKWKILRLTQEEKAGDEWTLGRAELCGSCSVFVEELWRKETKQPPDQS
jgi:hypothetical protein